MSWTHQRARVAGLSRSRPPSDPTLVAAQRALREARRAALADEYIAKLLECAPPLSAVQRERLRPLLSDRSEVSAA